MIGGSSWHTKLAAMTIMNQLQSPTLSLTDGGLTNAATFRTGIATQVSPMMAMAIHAIRWNFDYFTYPAFEDQSQATVAVLSEDIAATIAADELTDPRTLAEAGCGSANTLETAVGGQTQVTPLLWTGEFDPPIYTIAQSLRLVAQIVENAAATARSMNVHCKLYYTIETIDERFARMLIQRLNLAVQP